MINDERKMKNKYSDMINRLLTLNFFAMRKLYVYVAMFAIGTMAACQKNNDVNPQGGNDGVIDDNSPVAVQLGVSGIDISVSPKSKALGGVDEWSGQDLYIYAFDRNETVFTNPAFIDNVIAAAPASGDSAVIDVKNPYYPSEPFYYSGNTSYDFYGYYVDDAAVNKQAITGKDSVVVSEQPDSLFVPVKIDGTQDLMIAKADQTHDITVAGVGATVTADRAYSAYAARRGVHPVLQFEHQLARFVFEIVPGAAGAENISVTGITMKSRNTADLVFVGERRGLQNIGEEYVDLELKEWDDATSAMKELQPVSPAQYQAEPATGKQTPTSVGESLLVIPNDEASFSLTVSMTQKDVHAGGVADLTATIKAVDLVNNEEGSMNATVFEAGKEYKVTITIYSLEDVQITAALSEWKDGGSVVIDPDQMPVEEDDEEEQGGQDDQEQGGPQEP